MLKAVVFDMDDTLLSLNLSAFIAVLARDESSMLAQIGRKNALSMFALYGSAMLEINNPEPTDQDLSNREFFDDFIMRRCGVPMNDPVVRDAFEYYEREVLPNRNDAIIHARPRPGAREAVDAVASRGLRTALLTNPSFSEDCIRCRMGWGDMLDMPFELVTTMENSRHCKPSAAYYLESLAALGLEPHEVLMVGNDPKRDFPAPACGIQTAYVGNGVQERATWSGSMADFAASFNEIEERFYRRQEEAAASRA